MPENVYKVRKLEMLTLGYRVLNKNKRIIINYYDQLFNFKATLTDNVSKC